MKMNYAKLLAALYLLTACFAFAQTESPPPIFYGPYEQAHAGQFEGAWTRVDSTYRIVISKEGDKLSARYFNPGEIHVESIEAYEEEERMILKVVLRDEGYPGSTYKLEYLPQYRVLVGTYTIPGQEPTEVAFTQ